MTSEEIEASKRAHKVMRYYSRGLVLANTPSRIVSYDNGRMVWDFAAGRSISPSAAHRQNALNVSKQDEVIDCFCGDAA